MRFSGLIFPFPNPPTYSHDRLVGELLYVPKDFNKQPYKYMDNIKHPHYDSKISSMHNPATSATGAVHNYASA